MEISGEDFHDPFFSKKNDVKICEVNIWMDGFRNSWTMKFAVLHS